jgi:hypothetical protein
MIRQIFDSKINGKSYTVIFPSLLSDVTSRPNDIRQRFADLVKSPEALRLMKKSELQSVAVIVNDALPPSLKLDVWERDRDVLRNSIQDVFGFPRYELCDDSCLGSSTN